MSEIMKLISSNKKLALDACDGKKTIVKATDVFAYIDLNFSNWGTDVPGKATPETPVAVYEMAEDANFATMFISLSSDLDNLILQQD